MKVTMDDELPAYQLRKSQESNPSIGQWLIIIILGVFLGNTASLALERAIIYWELKQVAMVATAVIEETSRNISATIIEQKELSAQQRKIIAAQQKQRQIELEQKQAGYRQAKDTCDFWKQHLITDNTAKNRMYRDQACNLVNTFR